MRGALICLSHSLQENKWAIFLQTLNYAFIWSFIITCGNSLSSVSNLHSGSFTGALLQKEKMFLKSREQWSENRDRKLLCGTAGRIFENVEKGSILHLPCHTVVMFCDFARMLAAILSTAARAEERLQCFSMIAFFSTKKKACHIPSYSHMHSLCLCIKTG